MGDCLLSTKRLSVSFTNLSRAISCIEQRRSEDEHEEGVNKVKMPLRRTVISIDLVLFFVYRICSISSHGY